MPYCNKCHILSAFVFLLPVPVFAQDNTPGDAAANVVFTDHFRTKTMRVDYFHSGNATEQHVTLDQVVADGPWAGNRRNLVDVLDRGEYRFEVRDSATDRVLFRRGFGSVFQEWQTTVDAKRHWGTFHESLRFPWPKHPVQVVLEQRVKAQWRKVWSTTIDPDSRFVTNVETPRRDNVWTVFAHGDPAEKVDIVMLGDGYTKEEMPAFHAAARRLTKALFAAEPFKSRRNDFNVRAIDTVAAESGVSRPRRKVFRRSPLACQYNTFDLPRYVLTFDNRTVRDVAAQAPYDYLVILLNEKTYGGGGIYNDQTTVVADHALSSYIIVHEFGHHLAGLGDEYYAAPVAYATGLPITVEPWEPNITALLDGTTLKWQDLVEPDVPIPTPWNKEAYESRGKRKPSAKPEARKASQEGRQKDHAKSSGEKTSGSAKPNDLLAENEYYGKAGAFEGARYEFKGLYRPAVNCVMFSRNGLEFCPVCRRAIEQAIDMQTDHGSAP